MTEALLDNDVVFKTCYYSLIEELISSNPYGADTFYVLGAVKFMLKRKINKQPPTRAVEEVLEELEAFLANVDLLEPTADEIKLAADLEFQATSMGKELDNGESILCAVMHIRHKNYLFTGDKRAIQAIEAVVNNLNNDVQLDVKNKVICLEQLISVLLQSLPFDETRTKICQELNVDRALSACFACKSPQTTIDSCQEGLNSFINDLRKQAPSVLFQPIQT